MKRNIYFAFIFLVMLVSACKKEAGIGGKKTISGVVHYPDAANSAIAVANGASVMIAYGTKSAPTTYDQTVIADANGAYHFDGLQKGDYFITATFTDDHGFTYTTNGYAITVENKKDVLTVDIDLQ